MKLRALIIDDEVQIRRLLKVALEAAQYEVFQAETGQEGLAEVAYRRPDVILLDLGIARSRWPRGVEAIARMERNTGGDFVGAR